VQESEPKDVNRQIDLAYRLALGRLPDSKERVLAQEFVERRGLAGFTHVLLNLNEFVYQR
jgi:hypothetical protein